MKSRPTLSRQRRGLALTEVLICVAIAAMLLTATGLAFHASINSYRDNTDRNLLVAEGRIAMRQLITDIRQGDSHVPYESAAASSFTHQGLTIDNTGIVIQKRHPDSDDPSINPTSSSTWVLVTWRFDSANRNVIRERTANGTTTTTMTAKFVQDFTIHMEPARSPDNVRAGNTDFDLLLRAVVNMTLQNMDANGKLFNNQGSGDVVERLIDSAVPRRNFAGL
jgi:prepilin-type N-terminal cleavage/methylation domain-containing protein